VLELERREFKMAKKKTEDIKEEKVLEEKELKANINFKDKYTNELYEKDTIFVISETTETKKIENKKYEISKARAKELKAKGYVDIN
jgi:hypothetical protein